MTRDPSKVFLTGTDYTIPCSVIFSVTGCGYACVNHDDSFVEVLDGSVFINGTLCGQVAEGALNFSEGVLVSEAW